MSRLKIPIGANESELQHFCQTKQLFYDHTLTIYMSQSVRVKDNYFHINIIFFYLSFTSYNQPSYDLNFARYLIFVNYITKESHSNVI